MTHLSLNLRYFNYVEFTKQFCEVPAALWGEPFVVTFCFFSSVVYRSAKGAESFFNTIILNRETRVSDKGLSALGAGVKELGSLTNLSLDFWSFK